MSDNLDTLLVEFQCAVGKKDAADNPVKALERFLSNQERAFAVEEYLVKKEDLTDDADWVDWFTANPGETEAFVVAFFVEKIDKAYFDDLFAQYIAQKEKEAEQT